MMTAIDFYLIWHHIVFGITCLAVTIFILSGLEDLVYDLVGYCWAFYKFTMFANRDRVTLESLRVREQQQIAVMVPAWKEAAVIGKMVENILDRVEYRNYTIFVGTYPNDPETQRAVDEVAALHPQVVKVVTSRPGPTNKADNLNQIYRTIRACERSLGITFDIFVMHDAEDLVHPYSFLLYNYLIPRVEIIQLPILPLPVSHHQWTHWVYADEFTVNHMNDVIAREKMGGFVPFAGVGTGFSRRALRIIENESDEALFNEGSLTEDYSFSLKVKLKGLQSIFVRLVLGDDQSPWYLPLSKRPGFIANWAYFPMDLTRSIRQKTRWITGISLQEWERTGWKGNLIILENLFKDRKVFFSSLANVCGYLTLLYFLFSALASYSPVFAKLIPLIPPGSFLYPFMIIASWLMVFRLTQRFVLVTMVYGPIAGLLSAPRMIFGNIISIIAAYRALQAYWASRRGKSSVQWDKTDHVEGIGEIPMGATVVPKKEARERPTLNECLVALESSDTPVILHGLESIPRDVPEDVRAHILVRLAQLTGPTQNPHLRAMVARVSGFLRWPGTDRLVVNLLYDPEWVVRANAARAMLKYPHYPDLLITAFEHHDRFAWDVMVRELEQNDTARQFLETCVDNTTGGHMITVLTQESRLFLREMRALEIEQQGLGCAMRDVPPAFTEEVP